MDADQQLGVTGHHAWDGGSQSNRSSILFQHDGRFSGGGEFLGQFAGIGGRHVAGGEDAKCAESFAASIAAKSCVFQPHRHDADAMVDMIGLAGSRLAFGWLARVNASGQHDTRFGPSILEQFGGLRG